MIDRMNEKKYTKKRLRRQVKLEFRPQSKILSHACFGQNLEETKVRMS
jgi:hypothetical protein